MSTQLITVNDAQKGAWIKLAEAKNALVADLTSRELQLQGILLNVPDADIAVKLAEYRKAHTEMCDKRKSFTNIITDKLITPLMEYEKRADPKTNKSYIALSVSELEIRKATAAKATADAAIIAERASFKAHFQNEYMALVTKYRHSLLSIIQQCYADCLSAKTPPDQIDSALAVCKLAMVDVKPGSPNKFNRVHLQPADAAELYKTLHAPDWSATFAECQEELNNKFSMYAHDLANAQEAVEDSQREFEATIITEIKELGSEQAANVLMASAEAFVMPTKGVKELRKLVIKDDSEAWIVKVIGAFLANFNTAFPKTKNKKYSTLTVAQMCAALDSADVFVQGLEYQTIEK